MSLLEQTEIRNFPRLSVLLLTLLLLLSLLVTPSDASEPIVDSTASKSQRPLILVLSGGGARGTAHIGVLKVLERHGIDPDLIIGSSIGGIVGALWSSGYNSAEITKVFRDFDWNTLISDKPQRTAMFLSKRDYDQQGLLTLKFGPGGRPMMPTSITNGQVLYNSLRHLFEVAPFQPNPSFDALRFPVRIVSCDLNNGERKVFDSGDLALACRATLSYPLFLSPVPVDSHLYVDGGVAENLPAIVAREISKDALILAVDCTSPILSTTAPTTPWEVADRVTTILQQDRIYLSQANSDIVVKPKIDNFEPTDFSPVDSLIYCGEVAGSKMMAEHPELLSFRRNQLNASSVKVVGAQFGKKTQVALERPLENRWEQYYRLADSYQKNGWINGYIKTIDHYGDRIYYTVQPPILRDINVVGTSCSYANLMKGESGLELGEPLLRNDLERTVEYLYGSGMFEFVYPVREAVPGGIRLTFLMQERKLPVIRLGAGFDNHRGGSGQVQLLYDNILGITTHGAATFQFGERDASAGLRFHADRLVGRIGAIDFDVNVTRTEWQRFAKSQLSAISYHRVGSSASIGQAVGRWSMIEMGLRLQEVRSYETGNNQRYKLAPIFGQFTIDTEDEAPFPKSGTRLLSVWETAQENFISEFSYTRFYFYESTAFQLSKRLVVTPQAMGGFSNTGTPRSEWYRIGGPWDFWGLATGERESRNVGMAALTARYDLISRLVADTYIEMRANVAVLSETKALRWQRGERLLGGGVGVALSTWLGPMRFVYGWSGDEVKLVQPMYSISLGSSIPNPLGPRTIFK